MRSGIIVSMWVQDIEQDGYAIVPGVISETQISSISQYLEEAPIRRSRAGARHLLGDPVISGLANDSQPLGLAKDILGGEVFPFRATFFDKSSDSNWLVVWHQDTALPLKQKIVIEGWGPWSTKEGVVYAHAPTHALDQVVALRIHLDASMKENGPLRVLPRTHKLGVLSDEEVAHLAARVEAVDCLVPRGGVLAMRPLLIHCSHKSQNDEPRRVLHIEYASSLAMGDGLELAIA